MSDLYCLRCLEPFNKDEEEIESEFQSIIGDDIIYCTQYKSGWMKKRFGDNEFYVCPDHEGEEGEVETTN